MPMILKCEYCRNEFTEEDAPRDTEGKIYLNDVGYSVCNTCALLFDLLDKDDRLNIF